MKLAEWMTERGFDDEKVASLLDVDRTTVNRLRRGLTAPKWPLVAKIKATTDGHVTADDFLPVSEAAG